MQANCNLCTAGSTITRQKIFHDRFENSPISSLEDFIRLTRPPASIEAFGAALGVQFDDEAPRKAAEDAIIKFRELHPDASFAVGEWMNADPFELALALVRHGFRVPEIYGDFIRRKFCLCKTAGENKSRDKSIFQSGTNYAVL
ncbi:MAG: hypothetical protein ACLVAT_13685 [Lachnospiraceae bacterium]